MKRLDFLKTGIISTIAAAFAPLILKGKSKSTYDSLSERIGFNHITNREIGTENTVLHKANTRGSANHGWLLANHSFSFANYHNPNRMNFGVLRVLNDDTIAGGRGFRTHPHDNMEIITIPLEGHLEHKDNMGNGTVIKSGEIQVMSAGTGVTHSEFNANKDKAVKLLQIWLFPNKKGVRPRYQQLSLKSMAVKNSFYQILSPNKSDQGVWIHQNAWFNLGEFDDERTLSYQLHSKRNGVYAFVIDGQANIQNQPLEKRDGFGLWNTESITISAQSKSKILLMEVPMRL